MSDDTQGPVVVAVTARERGSARRPVPSVMELRAGGQHLHHVTGTDGGLGPDQHRGADPATAAEQAHAAAASVGADDLLVLRRLGGAGWTQLGGDAGSAAWAGTLEGDQDTDRRLTGALRATAPVRAHHGVPQHVIGPYWASTWAMVPVGEDVVVVFGCASPSEQLRTASGLRLQQAALRAGAAICATSPVRHLADEVEMLAAVAELLAAQPLGMDEALRHVCRTVVRALCCELAVVTLADGRFVVVQQGGELAASANEIAATVREALDEDPSGSLVVQDSATRPLPAPLSPAQGVASYLALSLPLREGRGTMLAAHSTDNPRGFSVLRQQVANRLAAPAAALLDGAQAREALQRALEASRRHAASDALTEVANRRGWDQALERGARLVSAGAAFTVVTVDIDGLKAANDANGHVAGDELILACARALRACVRGAGDVVARVGGDEFALLLAGADPSPEVIMGRLRRSLDGVHTPSGLPLRASLGAAACPSFGSLPAAVRRADALMYLDKRTRQSRRLQAASG